MADLTPATPIRLSKEKLQSLSQSVQNLITDLETQSAPLIEAMEIWQRNYEATPKHAVKNWPFRNSSNIVVPLAKMMVDSRVASIWNAIHGAGRNVWGIATQNTDEEDGGKQVAKYINWQADGNDFDFGPATYDWLYDQHVNGSGVLAGNWRDETSHVYVKKNGGGIEAVPISWNRGPVLEPVPRHQILWDTSYESIAKAPAVVRQFSKTWGELSELATQSDAWIPGAVEEVRGHSGFSGPEIVQTMQDELDNRGPTPDAFELHDVREVTVSWPHVTASGINGSDLQLIGNKKVATPIVDLVVTIHRSTGTILRLQSQPYFAKGKPFFDGFFHKRPGRGHSVGMVKVLEQLQVAMTVILNQGIDSQTRANSLWGKTNIRALVDQPIDMASWVFDPTMKGVEPLNFPGSAFMNIQLMQLIQATAERLSGQADPAFGRETRLGGHSAPATTTLALLERGNTLAAPDKGLITRRLSEAGEFVALLNQQFETNEDGKLEKVLGAADAEKAKAALFPDSATPMRFKFNIRGLSRTDNPEAELQKQVTIDQASNNYWGRIIGLTEGVAKVLQAAPDFAAINIETYTQAIRGLTQTHKRILDAADIDDTENFILTVNDPNSNTAEVLDALADRARQGAAAGVATGGQGPVGANGGTPPNGAAGPAGGAGQGGF